MIVKCFPRNIILAIILSTFFCVFSHSALAKNTVKIPGKIDSYTLKETEEFPNAIDGIVYHFYNKGFFPVNLYVYPILYKEIQDGVSATQHEANAFIESFSVLKANGIYDSISIIQNKKVTFGTWDGRVILMNIGKGGKELRSLVYIFSEYNNYFKIRTHYPIEDDKFQEIEEFVAKLLEKITIENKSIDKKKGEATIVLDPEVMQKQNLSEYWMLYGVALAAWDPKYLSDKALEPFEREVFVRSKVATVWISLKEKEKNVADKGLDDLAKIYRAGFMREYVWKYIYVPKTPVPDGLKHSEYETWEKINLVGHIPVVNTGVSLKYQ